MDKKTSAILIIDDEPALRLGLAAKIKRQGYKVFTACDGQDGLQKARECHPDLILSDVMMPPPNGFELRHLMEQDPQLASIPFIFLTARTGVDDRVNGIRDGADDYITKPFRMRELLVRMRAVLRRAASKENGESSVSVGDITLDCGKHEVTVRGKSIELTPLEFQVLELLMRAPGQVVKRADLCMRLMESGYSGSEATLKIHIHNLRLKLDDDTNQPRYIETVFGIGYRFIEAVE